MRCHPVVRRGARRDLQLFLLLFFLTGQPCPWDVVMPRSVPNKILS